MKLKFLYLNVREAFVKFHDITNQIFHWNCTESTEQLGVNDVFMKMTIHLCQSSSAIKYYHFLFKLLTNILLDLDLGTTDIHITSLNASL